MTKPLIIAFLFFSRLPMPRIEKIEATDNGRALVFLPLVGLVIGLLLWLGAFLLQGYIGSNLLAAILLALWCALTGGLHLDGLADSADAWLAGGDKTQSLEIMKDPRCGSGAIITLICVLLIKFTALSALLGGQQYWLLILVPILGRASALLLFLTTPYAREQGLSSDFAEHAPRTLIGILLIVITTIAVLLVGLQSALLIAVVTALLIYTLRRLMLQRLGGSTGDTSGALIEIIETGILVVLSIH